MGMSASQARYLNLIARQNNLEYQGQQINQERTILSQQVTSLYNSLLALNVPTPPSTNDFTKIEYSGNDGATKFKLGVIKPSGSKHMVEITTISTGDSLSQNYGTSVVDSEPEFINYLDCEDEKRLTLAYVENSFVPAPKDSEDNYYTNSTGEICGYMQLADDAETNYKNYYIQNADGTYTKATKYDSGETYYKYTVDKPAGESTPMAHTKKAITSISQYYVAEMGTGENEGKIVSVRRAKASDFDAVKGGFQLKDGVRYVVASALDDVDGKNVKNDSYPNTTIAGQVAYTWSGAMAAYPDLEWDRYQQAVENKFQNSNEEITKDSFMVYFTTTASGSVEPHFAFADDVSSPDLRATTYDYSASGEYTVTEMKDECVLTFDTSGRISAIDIPVVDETTGNIIAYNTVVLTATQTTDQDAYKDAYAQYEYDQYLYDKAQQEINAKTAIIQEEDRNLELKLQRLDNERTQITTELEALEKVINDNIEQSYKTFSG